MIFDKLFYIYRFALLGLGDSNYSSFCQGPRTIYESLIRRGGVPITQPAWADNGVGLEVTVEPWIENLWRALADIAKASKHVEVCVTEKKNKVKEPDIAALGRRYGY